jgi:type IX secretion system PorP/SprF family membrane protein
LYNKYTKFLKHLSRIISTSLIILTCLSVRSQDIHFSQFYASPLVQNAAEAGNFVGELRLADIYRTQWFTMPIPYVTNALSVDKAVYIRKQKFGIGFLLINDKSGDAQLAVNKLFFNLAYQRKFKQHVFSGGLQMGVVNKSISLSDLSFPDQYNRSTGYYDPDLPSSDAGAGTNLYYPDLNAGLLWEADFIKLKPKAGISFFHLNQPGESYFGSDNTLKMRQSYFALLEIDIKGRYDLRPAILFTEHQLASELVAGMDVLIDVQHTSKSIQKLYTGLYARAGINRNVDAAILHAGLSLRNFDFGISYDANVSSLSSATRNQGAIEFSIVYKRINPLYFQKSIPCERY